MPPVDGLGEVLEQRAEGILEGNTGSLAGAGIEVEREGAGGSSPASEIIGEAADGGYDMIILGRHGHGFFKDFLIGSVSDRVVRHAACPVLVVH